MLFPNLANFPPLRTRSGPARWPHRLAGPAAGLLVLSLAAGLTTIPANAVSSGTFSVAPSAGTVVALESTRLSSQTVIDLTVPASAPFYGAIQLRSATTGEGYRSKVRFGTDGAMSVALSRVAGGVETALGTS